MFLAIAYMFTDPMITLTDMFSAWETMCAGQLRSMTWATGDTGSSKRNRKEKTIH